MAKAKANRQKATTTGLNLDKIRLHLFPLNAGRS
jgi:hypothetical protein